MDLMIQAGATRKGAAARSVLVAILGLGCAGLGLFFVYHTCWPVWEWFESRHWQQATATIHKVRLETTGGATSPAYEVFCRYGYTHDGQAYTSDRVGLGYVWGQRNLWHQQAYRHLKKADQQGAGVTCFVNPANPQQAVLFRDLEPLALLYPGVPAGAFSLAGFLLLASGRRRRRAARWARLAARPDAAAAGGATEPAATTSTAAQPTTAAAPAAEALEPPPDEPQIQQYHDPWGNRWVRISCWPGALFGLAFWVLTLACTAGLVPLIFFAVRGEWVLLAPGALLGIIALLLWRHGLSFLGAYHLRLHAADLLVVRDYVLFSRHRAVSLPYILQVTHQLTATRGRTRYYAVRLAFTDGRTIKVADGVRGESAARWLAAQIARHLPSV